MTVAVLSVVLTAPVGAVATSLLGPVLLKKSDTPNSDDGGEEASEEKEQTKETLPRETEFNGRVAVYEGV